MQRFTAYISVDDNLNLKKVSIVNIDGLSFHLFRMFNLEIEDEKIISEILYFGIREIIEHND